MRQLHPEIKYLLETLTPAQQSRLVTFMEPHVTQHKRSLMRQVLDERTRYLTVVLEEIYQPHNASACLRSADCFGVQDVHIVEGENPYRVNKDIALGAAQWLSMYRYGRPNVDNTRVCLERLRQKGYVLAATTLREGSVPLGEMPLDRPVALLFGSEEPGLTEQAHQMADLWVHIPMVGFTQSFNISVSVALTLYELTNRLHDSEHPWRLETEERRQIYLEWLLKTATRGTTLARRFLRDEGLPLPE